MKFIYLLYQLNRKEGCLELCGSYSVKEQARKWRFAGEGRRVLAVPTNVLAPLNPWNKDEWDEEQS